MTIEELKIQINRWGELINSKNLTLKVGDKLISERDRYIQGWINEIKELMNKDTDKTNSWRTKDIEEQMVYIFAWRFGLETDFNFDEMFYYLDNCN